MGHSELGVTIEDLPAAEANNTQQPANAYRSMHAFAAGILNRYDRTRTALFVVLLYVGAIAVVEAVQIVLGPTPGALFHAMLIFMLLSHYGLASYEPYGRILPAIALAPLLRILSLVMPLAEVPLIYWHVLIGTPLIIAVVLAARLLDISWPHVGLKVRHWPSQLLIGLSGIPLSLAAFFILRPPPIQAQWWEIALGTAILIIFTGFAEEVIFRGILQRTASETFGAGGLLISSALFALMYIGTLSAGYVLFAGVVGLFFGWCAWRTGSIWGGIAAHSLISVAVVFVWPSVDRRLVQMGMWSLLAVGLCLALVAALRLWRGGMLTLDKIARPMSLTRSLVGHAELGMHGYQVKKDPNGPPTIPLIATAEFVSLTGQPAAVQEIPDKDIQQIQEPVGAVTRVSLYPDVYASMMRTIRIRLPDETVGALIGEVQYTGANEQIIVKDVMSVSLIRRGKALVPNLEDWEAIKAQVAPSGEPSQRIVGWYYSEAGTGTYSYSSSPRVDVTTVHQALAPDAYLFLLLRPFESENEGTFSIWRDDRFVPVGDLDDALLDKNIPGRAAATQEPGSKRLYPATPPARRRWTTSSRWKFALLCLLALIGVGLLANLLLPQIQVGRTPFTGSRTFPETGETVKGLFLEYWENNGALTIQGYPISSEFIEISDLNVKPYRVQYFERAVFEYHPENKPPYDILLSQLGRLHYERKYPQGAPGQQPNTSPGSTVFPETGKRLGGKFLQYWLSRGGLYQHGYPLSDEFIELSELNGKSYIVQYFERAVFEYHPENEPPNDVLLPLLGRFQYELKYGKK